MKKIILKVTAITTLIISLFTITTMASVNILFWHSNYTYVTSEHGDSYWDDTYYGEASVRGADRTLVNGRNSYFVWTRITYDVQGSVSSATAYSGGKNSTTQYIENLYAKDLWNDGPKTRAYYNYGTVYVDGNVGYSVGEEDIQVGGGVVNLFD